MSIYKEIIIKSEDMDRKKYCEFIKNKNYTCFQILEWLLIIETIRPDLKLNFFILCEDDKWVGIMPYYEKKYTWRTFSSLPYGGYGGFIYNEVDADNIRRYLRESKLIKMIGVINSFDGILYKDNLIEFAKQTTWVVDCEQTYDEFFKTIDSKTRNQIRKSEKSNVEYEEIRTKDEVLQCVNLYRELVKIHNITKPYSNDLFYKLMNFSGKNIKFIVAKKDGKVIAYSVFLVARTEIFYWLSAYNHNYATVNAPLGILNHILKTCFENMMIKTFNLGAIPTGNKGLMKFKTSILAKETSYSTYSTNKYMYLRKFIDMCKW